MKAGKRSNQRCRSLSALSSLTVRNPLFSVQKLIEQTNATFLFVKKKKQQQQQTTKNKQNDRNVIERFAPSCPREKANRKI